jgi:hypothetical protein
MRNTMHVTYGYGWLVGVLLLTLLLDQGVIAQEAPTATPVQVRIASVTPQVPVFTPTPTLAELSEISVPTQANVTLLEPLSEVNVRSSPEITEDNRIGAIRAGERYVVLGRYFNWYQFQYDQVPSRRGWVYSDLVEIIQGDPNSVPEIQLDATPTIDPAILGATQTREAILVAPGGALTVTAQSRIIQLPEGTTQAGGVVTTAGATVLPTFTYPPGISLRVTDPAPASIQRDTGLPNTIENLTSTTTFPPIIPIAALGLAGVLGLMVSVLRR